MVSFERFDGQSTQLQPNWQKVIEERAKTGCPGETSKAYFRRLKEGWFDKYVKLDRPGIDLGSGDDPLNAVFRRWDIEHGDGDATELAGIPSNSFWTVYASHILEHISYPERAVARWYEVLAPGGNLIISLPHRDLYEKRKSLPSFWNPDHKYFYLPDEEELPTTRSLKATILKAIPNANIVDFRVQTSGYERLADNEHSLGEYSIEAIIRK